MMFIAMLFFNFRTVNNMDIGVCFIMKRFFLLFTKIACILLAINSVFAIHVEVLQRGTPEYDNILQKVTWVAEEAKLKKGSLVILRVTGTDASGADESLGKFSNGLSKKGTQINSDDATTEQWNKDEIIYINSGAAKTGEEYAALLHEHGFFKNSTINFAIVLERGVPSEIGKRKV